MKKKQIRLLMVIDQFNIGGTETYVLSVLKELKRRGILVFAAGQKGPLLKEFTKLRIPIFTNMKNEQRFEHWIKDHKITIINAHMGSSGIRVAKISHKLNIPFVFTIHGTYYSLWKLRLLEKLTNTSFVSVSLPCQLWLHRSLGFHSKLIPNGIDTDQFFAKKPLHLKRSLGIPLSSPVLLYSSRLEGKKAKICKYVIRAHVKYLSQAIPELHLLVVGRGKQSSAIKKMTDILQHKKVHYLGPRVDMVNMYSISNCVIGTGRVALEAMACKRPIIAVGSAGMIGIVQSSNIRKAWIQNFADHKAIEAYSEKKIANAVKKVIRSTELQQNLGEMGRNFIMKNCGIRHVSSRLITLYSYLLSKYR